MVDFIYILTARDCVHGYAQKDKFETHRAGHQERQDEAFQHELKPLFVGSISFSSGKPSVYL